MLLSWSGCFFETSDRRRTVYTLREAIDLIAPLTTREEQRVLASCVSGLGQVYAENGWLDEARAMLLESLAMQHNAGPLRVMVLSKLANVQVQMGQLVEALESARASEQALGRGGSLSVTVLTPCSS